MLRVALLAVLAVVVAGCGGSGETPHAGQSTAPPTAALTDLDNVLDLRAAFNDDQGEPRLILLLSPT